MTTEKEKINEARMNRNMKLPELVWRRFQKGEVNLLQNLWNELEETIKAMNEVEKAQSYEAGKAEVLSGEYCVKLIEQGKEIGKSEQKSKTKEIIEKALIKANWDEKRECPIFGLDTINKLKEQLLQEIEK